jgi:hypothetical protein
MFHRMFWSAEYWGPLGSATSHAHPGLHALSLRARHLVWPGIPTHLDMKKAGKLTTKVTIAFTPAKGRKQTKTLRLTFRK